jgi:hypothetical protein
MEHLTKLTQSSGVPNQGRRAILAGMLTAYAATLIPWAIAEPVADADHGAFIALSAIIAGQQALDRTMAKRLYDALTADDSGFPAAARKLLALIEERKIEPLQLQQVLDGEKSPLADVSRTIATAWFMGIVGSDEKARVLAYENALNATIVSDVLKPPTYGYGVYGSWTTKPI